MAGNGASKVNDQIVQYFKDGTKISVDGGDDLDPKSTEVLDARDAENQASLEALGTGIVPSVDTETALMEAVVIEFLCICTESKARRGEENQKERDAYKAKFNKEREMDPCEEFKRQAAGQVAGLNSLTFQQWENNITQFKDKTSDDAKARKKASDQAKKICRANALNTKTEELISEKGYVKPLSTTETATVDAEAGAWMKRQAALHNSDQAIGGNTTSVGSGRDLVAMGDTRVNSSFGRQGHRQVSSMTQQADDRKNLPENQEKSPLYMNAKMQITCPYNDPNPYTVPD